MADWMPIETAPKDGTVILSWDGTQCAVVKFCACKNEWFLLEGDNRPHEECPIEWTFTHWQPLPEPPSGG